jgi:ACR3 family arsenite efflux pump ArsB
VVGVLIEVPLMIALVEIAKLSRRLFTTMVALIAHTEVLQH